MKKISIYLVSVLLSILAVSCGVSGDPGHCFISVDWEYYYPGYGVTLYEDNNPDVPDLEDIEPGLYYDSYPGIYEYYYESEDDEYEYYYTGVYTLVQNPGTSGGLFQDGMDGADTYFDLYLEVYAKKGWNVLDDAVQIAADEKIIIQDDTSGMQVSGDPVDVQTRSWERSSGDWTLRVKETVEIFIKQH